MRTQVGHCFQESNGDELTVYSHRYGNEEPDEIEISGTVCMVSFDPSTHEGRTQVRTFIARLEEALKLHRQACDELYGALRVGDFCIEIRLPAEGEPRCPVQIFPPSSATSTQCSRTAHDDGHHITVTGDYEVTAVFHRVALNLVHPDALERLRP